MCLVGGAKKNDEYVTVQHQQITFILKQVDDGTGVEEVCRRADISQQIYYRWRKKYGG